MRGAMLYQAHALTGQVAQPSLALGVDIPGRQDPESHQVRKPERVMLVVRVLESVVLNNRPSVHQAHLVPRIHQPIDQPVPIEGRLYRHSHELRPEWLQRRLGDRKIVRQTPFI